MHWVAVLSLRTGSEMKPKREGLTEGELRYLEHVRRAQSGHGVVAVLPFRGAEPVFSVQHALADAAQRDFGACAAESDGGRNEGTARECCAGTVPGGAGS